MNDDIDAEGEPLPSIAGDAGDDHQNFDDIANGGVTGDVGAPGNQATLNATLDFIPTEYEGAPDKVAKINIAYAKTAKVVDMKQLKSCCWRLIVERIGETQMAAPGSSSSGNKLNGDGQTSFSEIYKELPYVLSKSMSENISKSLAFYSVLHLTNERSLRLVRQDDLEDFKILPPV